MAFGGFSDGRRGAPMADINVIPLVDIMLVLLVIFIVSAPLLTNAVKIDLPKATSAPDASRDPAVQFAVDAAGQFYWDGEKIDHSQMLTRLRAAGGQNTPPELHLHIDRQVQYETVAEVMSEASKAGVAKIGFVTDPSGVVAAGALPKP